MNEFFRILFRSAWEEARSIPKRPWEWLTALALPALWCGLLMAVFAQGLVLRLPVGVVDEDHSAMSREVISTLSALPSMELRPFADGREADRALRATHTYATLTIPAGFEKDRLSGRGAPVVVDFNKSYYAVGTVLEVDLKSALAAMKAASAAQRLTMTGGTIEENARRLRVTLPDVYFLGNAAFNFGAYIPTAIVPGLVALAAALTFCGVIIRSWREGRHRAWRAAHENRVAAGFLGELLPWTILFTLGGALWMAVFSGWLGWGVEGAWAKWLLATHLLVLCSAGLALFFSAFGLSWVIAVSSVICLLAPTFPFTGFSYPIESMTPGAKLLAEFLPLTHYLKAQANEWILAADGFAGWKEIAWLAGFAALTGLAGLGLLTFRSRLWAKAEEKKTDAPDESGPSGFWGFASFLVKKTVFSRDTFLILAGATAFYLVFYAWPYMNQQIQFVPVAIVDEDATAASRRLRSAMEASPVFDVRLRTPDAAEAIAALRAQDVDVVVTIPKDLEEHQARGENATVHVLANGAFPVKGRAVQAALAGIVTDAGLTLDAAPLSTAGLPPSTLLSQANAAPDLLVRYRFNEISGYGNYTVPAVGPLIVQAVLLMGITVSVGGWLGRRPTFLKRILARPSYEGLALFTVFFMIALLWLAYMVVVDFSIHEYGTLGNPAGVALLCVLYAAAIALFGFFVALVLNDNAYAAPAVVIISAPVLFMSGIIWPTEAISVPLVHFIAAFFPSTPAILGLVAAGQDAASTADLLPRMTHLLLLILLYGSLSLYWAGRRRAEFDRKLSQ